MSVSPAWWAAAVSFSGIGGYLWQPNCDEIYEEVVANLTELHNRTLADAQNECDALGVEHNRTLHDCLGSNQLLEKDMQELHTSLNATITKCETTNANLRTGLLDATSREHTFAQAREETAKCVLSLGEYKQKLRPCEKDLKDVRSRLDGCIVCELEAEARARVEARAAEKERLRREENAQPYQRFWAIFNDQWLNAIGIVLSLVLTMIWKRRKMLALTSENTALTSRNATLMSENAALKCTDAPQEKIERDASTVSDAASSMNADERSRLVSSLECMSVEMAQLRKASDDHEASTQQKFSDLEAKKSFLEDHVRDLEGRLASTNEEKLHQLEQVTLLSERLAKEMEALHEEKEKCAQLEERRAKEQEEEEQCAAQLDEMREKYASLRQDWEELKVEYEKSRKNYDLKVQEYLDIITEESTARKEVEKELTHKDSEIASFEEELKEKEDLAASLARATSVERQFEESKESIRLLEQDLDTRMQEKAEMDMQALLLQEQLEGKALHVLREEAKVSMSILVKQELEEEVQKARDEVSQLRAKLALAHAELEESRLHEYTNVKQEPAGEHEKDNDAEGSQENSTTVGDSPLRDLDSDTKTPPISPANSDVIMGHDVAEGNGKEVQSFSEESSGKKKKKKTKK